MTKKCNTCGNDFQVKPSHYDKRKTCSRKCGGILRRELVGGEKHGRWKGGTRMVNGYRQVKKWGHPFANTLGYVYEHRLVVEQAIGRFLQTEEEVHHKDGNKSNNVLDNLEVMTKGEHMKLHASLRNK